MHTHPPAEILVLGAGPVGLLAAISAARLGLKVQVLDESPRVQSRGHATILHAGALRVLEELGLTDRIVTSGHRLDRVVLYIDGARAATLELASPALALPQSTLETTLNEALRAEGVEVQLARQATTISERDGRVQVRVMRWETLESGTPNEDGVWQPVSSSVVDADFVIGADGRSSRVRSALGIEAIELGVPVSYAMFELPSNDCDSEIVLAISEGVVSAMIPLPGGRVRWGFQLESRTTETLYSSDLCALLARRVPWYRGAVGRIDWGSVVRFERRLARRFGKSRAWLAGDAAHGTSPLGGQSMNVGLSEAHDLVRRIAQCVRGEKPPTALEQYGVDSQREWQKLLGFNVSFDLLPQAPAWLSAHARRILPALPASGPDLESLLGQLGLVVR